MAKRKIEFPKRVEIYLVNFDPTVGSEIQKTRPALNLTHDLHISPWENSQEYDLVSLTFDS
jgi:hypothetical protein